MRYEEDLKMLNLPTLNYHSIRGDTIELYKIILPVNKTVMKLYSLIPFNFKLHLTELTHIGVRARGACSPHLIWAKPLLFTQRLIFLPKLNRNIFVVFIK